MPSITIEQLTEDHYKMIEEMAGTGFTPAEISEVLEMDEEIFITEFNNKESKLFKKYRKGFLESDFKLKQRIFRDANNGSSPAQTLAKKILDECIYKLGNK